MGEEERERKLESAPRLRDGISLVPRGVAADGVIVADREGRRHFLVGAVEGRLLALLDGTRRLRTVHQTLAAEFREFDLPVETVIGFAARLEELGLLEGSALPPRRSGVTSQRLFYLQISLGNPEQFFRFVVARCPFLFTRAFWTAAAALIAVALVVAVQRWPELRHEGFRFHSLPGLLLMWGALFLIGTIHEMGHGLTCTYFGAPSTRWGLLFMYFMPCAFCDVSAAWTLPKKSQRLAVGAAGLAFQWVAGAAAVMLWRVVEPGTMVARLLATIAGTCGLASLLNLWPFMRLDGYYLLSDMLEVPNLRTRSVARLKAWLRDLFLGLREAGETSSAPSASSTREARILAFYGAGVATWSGVMLWIMAHRLAHLVVTGWGGLLALSLVVALLIRRGSWPQWRLVGAQKRWAGLTRAALFAGRGAPQARLGGRAAGERVKVRRRSSDENHHRDAETQRSTSVYQ